MNKLKLSAITLALVLAMVVTINYVTPALAAPIGPDQVRVAKFWIGKQYYEVDGQRQQMDVAPYVKNGRTMMPARYLAYSLGIPESSVKWFPDSESISIDRGTEHIGMNVGDPIFSVNGRLTIGRFDVAPELVPPGRAMIPYRAVAQALGALVFWDGKEQAVIVETWREVPEPVKQTVKKVTVTKNQSTAEVVDRGGKAQTVTTDRPVMITDPRDGGFTLDVVEWFKLWGVPESSMLYDPVRGGLAVRGASGDYPGKASGYLYFYKDDKYAWNNFFEKTVMGSKNKPEPNLINNGNLYSGVAVVLSTQNLFGKLDKGPVEKDKIIVDLE